MELSCQTIQRVDLGRVCKKCTCSLQQQQQENGRLLSRVFTYFGQAPAFASLSSLLGCEPVLSPPYMNFRGWGENLFMLNLTVLKAQYTNKTVMRIAGLILKSTKFGFSISNCQILITVLLVYCGVRRPCPRV